MKQFLTFLLIFSIVHFVDGQPLRDTAITLVPQKENVITEETIVKVENLGAEVNSALAELRPTVSPDGNLLFFIRQNHPYNTKYYSVPNSQDIWFSFRDSLGRWSKAVHLGEPLNTVEYNAVFWISPDNNRILIRNAFINGDYFGNGISMCYLTEYGNWSKPEMLRIKNLDKYNKGFNYGATMANDGRTLLLYMSEERNSRNNDIYVCFLEEDGTWTEPKGLGKMINLKSYNELTPYLASDGETLYFSSNRPGGLGDNDIWKTKRLDSTWQNWSEPENLGGPINTPEWDAFFTLDAGGEYAYLTTNQGEHGASDIVRIKLLEIQKPDPVILVTGNVYNIKTNEPLSASLVYQTLPDGTTVGDGISNPYDGSFKIVLPYDKNYTIRAYNPKFFAISENLNLEQLVKAGYKEIHRDLYLAPIEIGQVVRLNNVFFDFDKWDLRPESYLELVRVVQLLEDNPTIEIEMSAHTDSYGTDEYNFVLSDKRAKSVTDYILSRGINPSRIISKGYGESMPVATNETDEGRQLNRRVEFKILKN